MKAFVTGLLALVALAGPAFAQSPATFRPNSIAIDSGTKAATAVSGAATLAKGSGVVTSEALTTAAAATYTLTITDAAVSATDLAFASVKLGTATTGLPEIATVTPGAGSLVVVVRNAHASAALNGTIAVSFFVLKR
jgi:hypothetical protein